MTAFISHSFQVLSRQDLRAGDEAYFSSEDWCLPQVIADVLRPEEPVYGIGFINPWWPAGTGFLGDQGVDLSLIPDASWWGDPWASVGACNGRLSFVGITRDANGKPLPNATVRCFRTSTNELVATVTSNANGYYNATTPYGDAHFLTVHAATSPPVAGASVDTLTPG